LAAAVMTGARTTRAERMPREKAVLLASPHGEADEVARKMSLLEGGLAVARLAWDPAEVKLRAWLTERSPPIDNGKRLRGSVGT
jgi:hypothetical protein